MWQSCLQRRSVPELALHDEHSASHGLAIQDGDGLHGGVLEGPETWGCLYDAGGDFDAVRGPDVAVPR